MARPPRPARASQGRAARDTAVAATAAIPAGPKEASRAGAGGRAAPGAAMDHKPLLQERPPAYNLEAGQGDYACGPHGYGAIPTAPPPPPYPYLVTGGPAARRGPRAASRLRTALSRRGPAGGSCCPERPARPGPAPVAVNFVLEGLHLASRAHPQARSAQLEAGRTGVKGEGGEEEGRVARC